MYSLLSLTAAFASMQLASAGFSTSSSTMISMYWGQNSFGQSSGDLEQQDLAFYCANTDIDVIPMAFLDQITSGEGGIPVVNFANSGNACTLFDGTELLDCPQIAADIETCQNTYGKTILLSIGGATYTEGGFTSEAAATTAAQLIWAMFGPVQSGSSALRPFGTSVIDGFDFDFETTVSNTVTFANELRSLMDADTSKSFYLSAAPQCPFPDAADNTMLSGGVFFDMVFIQFYNNFCGVVDFASGNYNFDTWNDWATGTSANKDVKLFMGVPANTGAGGGFVSAADLVSVIDSSKAFSNFGGVMMWDASQAQANTGFTDAVKSALTGANVVTSAPATGATPTVTISTTLATVTTSAVSGSSTGLAQWAQCGGMDYTGATVCAAPFSCEFVSEWWSQCD